MRSKLIIMILLTLLLNYSVLYSGNKQYLNFDKVKDIYVYKYFGETDFTFVEANRIFKKLERDSAIAKIQLSSILVDSMKTYLNRLEKRDMPNITIGNTGPNILFVQFLMMDNSIRNVLVNSKGVSDSFVDKSDYFFLRDDVTRSWFTDIYIEIMKQVILNAEYINWHSTIVPDSIVNVLLSTFSTICEDSLATLSNNEGNYLNCSFIYQRGLFDFRGKTVAIYNGNAGTLPSNKRLYFEREKAIIHSIHTYPISYDQLIVFNQNEANQIGYDAMIIYNSKKYISQREALRRLKKNSTRTRTNKNNIN